MAQGAPSHAHLIGNARQHLGRDPQRGQVHQRAARLHTVKPQRVIGWILDPLLPAGAQIGAQIIPADRQQRAKPDYSLRPALCRHCRQTVHPCPPREPHQNRFSLIVLRMAQGHRAQPCRPGPIRDQRQAGAPGLVLQVAGPVPSLPLQRVMGHAKPGAETAHPGRLGRRFGAEPMIDGHRADLKTGIDRQQKQRHRIPTPGNRKAQRMIHRAQRGPEGRCQRCAFNAQVQPSPSRAVSACCAGADPGNRTPTSRKVTQASGT